MKAHGHYFSSEIPWESSARSHGHNTTILILNFNEKHKCSAESSPESDWLGQQPSTNEASREFEIMAVIIKTKKLQYFTCTVLCWSVVLLCLSVSLCSLSDKISSNILESLSIPVWHPVCFYSVWLNIVSLDFMLISGILIQSHRVQLKELLAHLEELHWFLY